MDTVLSDVQTVYVVALGILVFLAGVITMRVGR